MIATAVSPYQVFGCTSSPFRNALDTRYFYRTDQHEEGIARISLAIEDNRGMALIQGAPGTGKTLISQMVLESLPRDRYTMAFLAEPEKRTSGAVFLKTLLTELGTEPRKLLFLLKQQFRERAVEAWQSGRRIVMVLDEAHLYNTDTMETIRVLLNVESSHEKLVTIILLAQPEIQARLKRMPQLDQRIDFRLVLGPLTPEQVSGYIQHRLQVSGCRAVFSPGAQQRIIQETRIPRQINLICDHALLIAAGSASPALISESVVERAIQTWKGQE